MKYRPVKIREDIAVEFKKRAKSIGFTYTDYLKKLMAENENKKARELKEFVELIYGLYEKLLEIENLITKKNQRESSYYASNDKKVLLAIRELARKLIVIPANRKDFDEFMVKLLGGEE